MNHTAAAVLGTLLGALLQGCQSYERAPLELPDHAREFLARTPDAPEVRRHVEALQAKEPDRPVAFDPSDGVTLAEAELVALVFNADLRMARLRAGVTEASAANAGLWEDPVFGLDITRILESPVQPWEFFGTIALTIPVSGRLELEKQRAGLEHSVELARVASAEWSTRMQLRRAWIEWVAAESALESTREFVPRMEQVLEVVDRIEQAGEMARTEARLLRIEVATQRADLAMLEGRALEFRRRIHRLMGIAPGASIELRGSGFDAGAPRVDPSNEIGAAELVERCPALLVAATEYEVAEASLELEVRRQIPDLQLGPGYGTQDGDRQVLIGLSAPIPILNANRREIALARARRELARAGAEASLEHLLDAVDSARIRAASAAAQRRAIEQTIVPLVDAQYADSRRLAELGEVDTIILLESLTRQQQVRARLIAAHRDEAIAAIDLAELVGPEVRPSPSRREPTTLADWRTP